MTHRHWSLRRGRGVQALGRALAVTTFSGLHACAGAPHVQPDVHSSPGPVAQAAPRAPSTPSAEPAPSAPPASLAGASSSASVTPPAPALALAPDAATPVSDGLPADAQGLYRNEAKKISFYLLQIGARPFFIFRGAAVAIRVAPSRAGFRLSFPQVSEEMSGFDDFPSTLALFPPKGSETRWKLGDDRSYVQWRDAFASKIAADTASHELVRLDEDLTSALEKLRGYTRLIRERPAAAAHAASQLGFVLKDLALAVAPNEQARFLRYEQALELAASNPGALWPAADEAYLVSLANRRWASKDVIAIHGGLFATLLARDKPTNPRCLSGLILPDPTENNSVPIAPFHPPKSGFLGAFPELFIPLQTGSTDQCEPDLTSRATYPVQSGGFPFRIFADSAGHIIGAQVVGYMVSTVFVSANVDPLQLGTMLKSNADEISHQAE